MKKVQLPNSKYIDLRRVRKFTKKWPIKIVCGPRGDGKTTSMDHMLNNFIYKEKKKFVWLMRTDEELKLKKGDLFVETHPTWSLIKNDIYDIIKEKRIDKKGNEYTKIVSAEKIGKLVTINGSSKYRSGASFKEYNVVIWDEFQDENNKYLTREAEKLFSLLETILRTKKKGEAEIWLISNEVSKYCPVFDYIKLKEHPEPGTIKYFPQFGACYYRPETSEQLRQEKRDSIVGKFTHKSDYAKYAYEHQWKEDDDTYIDTTITGIKKEMFNIIYLKQKFGVWRIGGKLMITSQDLCPTKPIYGLTQRDCVEYGLSFTGTDWFANLVRGSATRDKLVFKEGTTKDIIFTLVGK